MRSIVVGYDGSDAAKRALERAGELAKDGVAVTVVNAVYVPVPTGRGPAPVPDPVDLRDSSRALDEAKGFLAGRGITPRLVQGHGDPADVIVEEAKEVGADLIIVGTHGKNVAERLVLGSVSTKVVHHAPCDVLVVR